MEKGWGVTLADHNSDHPVGFLFNKSTLGFTSSSPRFNQQQLRKPGMFSPVSLNRREENAAAASASSSPPPADHHEINNNHREVDFFSSKSNDRIDSKVVVKKEHSHGDSAVLRTDIDVNVNTGLHLLTTNTQSDQSSVDDGTSSNMEDKRAKNELAVLQVELERMNTENQRLRGMLAQVSNNYSALQLHFVTLMQQQQQNSRTEITQKPEIVEGRSEDKKHDQVGSTVVPRQFMDLGPSGATPAMIDEPAHDTSSEERTQSGSAMHTSNGKRIGREETPDSEGWGPNKAPKLNVPKSVEQATEATMRKARVSVRARSEAPMISDGCQWRKYGQKMAKGNPCPRAYYRCTMAVGCPVRKQVQRCADDRAILITTYEGNHNHPLPPAAMAMASTTSAAASMLLSGSMPSADGLMNPNFLARAILPSSSSVATISASAPFPTVTLDLTHTRNPFQRPSNQFQVPPQNVGPATPQLFGQGLYNQSQFSGLQLSQNVDSNQLVAHHAAPPQFHQPESQTSFADTLSAATAAITADPNFTAALAAAITSIIGGNNNNNNAPTPTSTNNNSNNSIPTSSSHKTSSFPGN